MAASNTKQPTVYVLALDVGTSSVRSLLFDLQGNVVPGSEGRIVYDMTTTPDGGAFVDARELFDHTCTCIGQTLRSAPAEARIVAAGMSTFWHGLFGVDGRGEPVIPVLLWADTRSVQEVDELRATADRVRFRDLTGCVFHSSYWPAKLRWLRRTQPKAFARVERWCSFSDYVLERITGFRKTSVCMASGTGLLDVRRGDWAELALELAGITRERLPEIAADREGVTGLLPEFAARWPALDSTMWLPGLGDGACANAGTGAFTSERIALTLGTSGAMRIAIDCPSGSDLAIPDDLWAYRLDHRHVVIGAAISNGGIVLAWLGDLLGVEFNSAEMEAAGELKPDSAGLTILPFLAGERAPIWNDHATAVVAGLTLSTTRAQLIRAGMESVSLRFARLYEGFGGVAAEPHQIVANGAALLKSRAWLQITADALGHEIVALDTQEESSARGAAVMALFHSGAIQRIDDVRDPAAGAEVISPGGEYRETYRVALERQRLLEHILFKEGESWEK